MKISIIIPALNEEQAIPKVLAEVPHKALKRAGYTVEVIVVDNGSTDRTAELASAMGAIVVPESMRGYGNAYRAGFTHATGDIIATGDADMTYPFSMLPELVGIVERESIDFLNTDRLSKLRPGVMSLTHRFGNRILTLAARILFGWPFRDSQSGMWVFRRSIWPTLDMTSGGMAFSQEIKLEAYRKGHRCTEVPIDYRARIGKVKLSTFTDGWKNSTHLLVKWLHQFRDDAVSVIHRTVTEAKQA